MFWSLNDFFMSHWYDWYRTSLISSYNTNITGKQCKNHYVQGHVKFGILMYNEHVQAKCTIKYRTVQSLSLFCMYVRVPEQCNYQCFAWCNFNKTFSKYRCQILLVVFIIPEKIATALVHLACTQSTGLFHVCMHNSYTMTFSLPL